jgi:hypothetical protein
MAQSAQLLFEALGTSFEREDGGTIARGDLREALSSRPNFPAGQPRDFGFEDRCDVWHGFDSATGNTRRSGVSSTLQRSRFARSLGLPLRCGNKRRASDAWPRLRAFPNATCAKFQDRPWRSSQRRRLASALWIGSWPAQPLAGRCLRPDALRLPNSLIDQAAKTQTHNRHLVVTCQRILTSTYSG